MIQKIQLLYFFLLLTVSSYAQLPDTDIWLLDMTEDGEHYSFSNPLNITNRIGYDNQPVFSPDGKYILYSSVRDDAQADIYKYIIKSGVTTRFTSTVESEYSPTFTPDGQFISTVRVEKDSSQRLWKFPLAGEEPLLVMKEVDSIGYHCWINKDTLALFILTKPFTLQLVDIKTQKPTIVADSIGRCMQKINKNIMLFIRKSSQQEGVIMELDLANLRTSKIRCYSLTLPGSEDYVYNGNILMCNKEQLYVLDCNADKWNQIADFSQYGITSITRFVISSDRKKIAIVSNKKM